MKTILIGEDSLVVQNIARKVLEFQNFRVLTAKNGEKVLEVLQKEDVDIVLLDLNMPVMNGEDCARAIRNLPDPKKSQVPIVAITGNAPNYTIQKFKELGFDDFIPKPINFDLLVGVVKKITGSLP